MPIQISTIFKLGYFSYYWVVSIGFVICYVVKLGVEIFGFEILSFIFEFGTRYSWNNSPSQMELALLDTHWSGALFKRVRQPCERMPMTGLQCCPGPDDVLLSVLRGMLPTWRLSEMLQDLAVPFSVQCLKSVSLFLNLFLFNKCLWVLVACY